MAAHRIVYRATGGRIGGRMFGAPVLLLTTTGRRTGKPRTTPLMYRIEQDALVLAASNGGSDRMPTWYLNLRADPQVTVELGRETSPLVARKATPSERDELWPKMVEMYSGYASYEKKTSRTIPVVILEPPAEGSGD